MPDVQSFYRLGLIGFPVEGSLSPLLHTCALHESGLEGEYRLYPTPPQPQGNRDLLALMARIRKGEIHGLNVTIPHKQSVIPLLDQMTPTAATIGAVNTLYCDGDRLVGDNTDAPGFLTDLKRYFPNYVPASGPQLPQAMVLGAGGAARAVIHALRRAGWSIILAARNRENVQELASRFPGTIEAVLPLPFTGYQLATLSEDGHLSLVVNTTPLGMVPDADTCPWPAGVKLPPDALVYDLVYKPALTKLVQLARADGLIAANGLGMLIEQAALAFEIWTGKTPTRESMWQVLADEIRHS